MRSQKICYCFEVYQEQLIEIIQKHQCTSVEDVQLYCQASMGCGGCRFEIEDMLEEHAEQQQIVLKIPPVRMKKWKS